MATATVLCAASLETTSAEGLADPSESEVVYVISHIIETDEH